MSSAENTTSGGDLAHLGRLRGRRGFGFTLECLLFDNGFQAVKLHRMAAWFKRLHVPFFGALIWRCSVLLTGVDINPNARIGPGLVISHGVGLVVGGDVVIGADCLLHHGVTLGAPTTARIGDCPRLGDRIVVGAGAQVIGAVHVADDATVGAGALVTEDVPAGALARAPRALIQTSGSQRHQTDATHSEEVRETP